MRNPIGKELLTPPIIICFMIITGTVLLSTKVIADTDVIDTVTLGVPQSCTISGAGMTSHNAEIENGTYTPNIGTTTLHIFCNDNAGFAVYAVGYTDNEFGKNVLTNSTLGSAYNIATGTATSGNTSNWAMKLAITQDSGNTTSTNALTLDNNFGNYQNVPATYTKIAHKNTSTDMANTTGGVKLTTTYAALISSNQPAGTYTGQVKYTLVHPASETPLQPVNCPSGKICYNPNGGNVAGTMGQPTISDSDTSTTLLASNFSREDYGFAGWNDKYDYTGNFYGPQESITFTAGQYTGTNNGLALYAIWIKSQGSLQDASKTAAICNGLTQASTSGTRTLASISALTDTRDNQTYAIAKLADGKCWMIENLRLESTNSDNSTGTLAQGYGTSAIYGNFSGLATAESANFTTTNPPVANSLYSTDGTTANTILGGNSSEYYTRIPRYNNVDTQSRSINPIYVDDDINFYSYGNHYNWPAAIANVKEYNSRTSTDDEGKTSETANTSLCPSNWKLPRGGEGDLDIATGKILEPGDYYDLNYALGAIDNYTTSEGDDLSNIWRSYPNNFLRPGYIGYFWRDKGYDGYYLTSTASNVSSMYILAIENGRVLPGTMHGSKYIGYSIRCTLSVGT